jgi:hypothetical protein
MPYDPTLSVLTADEPERSPTTMVLNYLKSKGITAPTNAQVRDALRQNALNGGKLIPGLRNEDPGEDPNNKTAKGGPPVGQGGGSSVASKVEGDGSGVGYDRSHPDTRVSSSSSPLTSAPPAGAVGGNQPLGGVAPSKTAPASVTGAMGGNDPLGAALDKATDVSQTSPPVDPELGYGGAMGNPPSTDALLATLGLAAPSAANAILGNRPPGVPPVLAMQPGGGIPPSASGNVPIGPPPGPPGPQFGPPTPGEAATAGVRPLPPGPLPPPGGPVSPTMIPDNVGPTVPFTPRAGGAPRTAPPPMTAMEQLLEAMRQGAKAGRMFRK